MDNGRQRAHSASSLKSLHIYGPSSKWTKRQARSTPELRLYMQQSMLSGLNTTVPQSLIPQDFARKHKPKSRSSKRKGCCTGNFCRSCCSLRLFLVFWQLILGAAITAMSFYLFFYVTDSLKVRDTPFWAGIPLFLAGALGIYVCANDYENYIGSTKNFVLKGCCFVLTVVCVFVCLVASTFPVMHIVKMYGYHHCEDNNNDCLCYGSLDPLSRQFTYKQLGNCDILYCLVKIFFIVQSGLCALGSGISFWFAILLWKSQYGVIYSGMRYSFNSHTNGDVGNNV